MVVNIRLTVKGLDRVIAKTKKMQRTVPIAGKQGVREYADMLIRRMQMIISKDIRFMEDSTGQLINSFDKREDERGITVYNTAPHAGYADYGAVAHDIYPITATKLHWNRYGVDYFAGHVNHPGIRNPMKFSERALIETNYAIKEIIGKHIRQVIARR